MIRRWRAATVEQVRTEKEKGELGTAALSERYKAVKDKN